MASQTPLRPMMTSKTGVSDILALRIAYLVVFVIAVSSCSSVNIACEQHPSCAASNMLRGSLKISVSDRDVIGQKATVETRIEVVQVADHERDMASSFGENNWIFEGKEHVSVGGIISSSSLPGVFDFVRFVSLNDCLASFEMRNLDSDNWPFEKEPSQVRLTFGCDDDYFTPEVTILFSISGAFADEIEEMVISGKARRQMSR